MYSKKKGWNRKGSKGTAAVRNLGTYNVIKKQIFAFERREMRKAGDADQFQAYRGGVPCKCGTFRALNVTIKNDQIVPDPC